MCMIMALAGIKADKEKQDLVWKFLMTARPFMTAQNRDGVGYAAMGNRGVWGERWLNPLHAWKLRPEAYNEKDEAFRKKFGGDVLEKDVNYNSFGNNGNGIIEAVIYHTRTSTNEVSMENVHPFVDGQTALIHNGVVNQNTFLKNITSTCDSEMILNEYVKNEVTENPMRIHTLADHVQGSYGIAVLTIDSQGRKFLDLFRHTSSIYAAYVAELETVVYCTSDDVIRWVCKELKLTYGHMFKLKEEVLIRVDVKTGLRTESIPFRYNSNSGNTFPVSEKKTVLTVVPSQQKTEEDRTKIVH